MQRTIGLMLAGVLMVGAPGVAGAVDPDELARRVHAEGRYPERVYVDPDGMGAETVLEPGQVRDEPEEQAERSEPAPQRSDRRWLSDWQISSPIDGAVLAYTVLIVLIAALVAFVVWLVFQGWQGRAAGAGERAEPEPNDEQPGAAEALAAVDASQDPDALARAGRLDEAVAVLLVRALQAVGWRAQGEQRSFTAREVLARVPRGDGRRAVLQRIVRTAEVARFGPVPVEVQDYQAVRRDVAELLGEQGGSA